MRVIALAVIAVLAFAAEQTAPLETYKPGERRHWAFQPRKNVAPPVFKTPVEKAWIKTPVDAFILDKLKQSQLKYAPAADRATLIRRATFDLHGLPPTPAEIDAFVRDR